MKYYRKLKYSYKFKTAWILQKQEYQSDERVKGCRDNLSRKDGKINYKKN